MGHHQADPAADQTMGQLPETCEKRSCASSAAPSLQRLSCRLPGHAEVLVHRHISVQVKSFFTRAALRVFQGASASASPFVSCNNIIAPLSKNLKSRNSAVFYGVSGANCSPSCDNHVKVNDQAHGACGR